ncbi:MAG: hypothetical protein LBN39_04905, partial [Planctomycetaceae bacterium]|nr:hypothetical protein [Planctomycetaceae bacterium]
HHRKAEAVLAERGKGTRFTSLTIRAVSKLPQLLRTLAPYWTVFDRMLLIKGPKWVDERGEARHYNLMTKLALRCLKKYPTAISETQSVESVVLQVCQKDSLTELDSIIDAHKFEKPAPPEEFSRRHFGSKRKSAKRTAVKRAAVKRTK